MFNNLIIFYLIFCFQINFISTSSINCTFEKIKEEEDFCGWKPENSIWKTGNEVLVDSVNYVIHSSSGGDRFAYVQGHYGSPLEGKLSSPLISSDKKLLQRIAKNEQCTAVSCSFMDGICLWDLGPGWKSDSHGSVSIELKTFSTLSVSSPLPLSVIDHSQMISALFRPPVASYVDFDLWLSNNVKFAVVERINPSTTYSSSYLNEDLGEEKEILKLFEREGATEGGWHRFRVPLRPSFLPVRLLFIVELILLSKEGEEEGFVSLSNIKLVNNEGIEIGCQTLEDNSKTTTTISFIKEEGEKEEGEGDNIKEYGKDKYF
uniref:MAM domain-containing protein n=1 Tax=Meloidogyne javanica TaxID=6303 RepID=A0A915LG02_MELJA